MYNKQGTYAVLLIRLATDRHTHPKRNGANLPLFGPSIFGPFIRMHYKDIIGNANTINGKMDLECYLQVRG